MVQNSPYFLWPARSEKPGDFQDERVLWGFPPYSIARWRSARNGSRIVKISKLSNIEVSSNRPCCWLLLGWRRGFSREPRWKTKSFGIRIWLMIWRFDLPDQGVTLCHIVFEVTLNSEGRTCQTQADMLMHSWKNYLFAGSGLFNLIDDPQLLASSQLDDRVVLVGFVVVKKPTGRLGN